ncbi:MAG: hypothetical protein IJH40_09800 [Ruminococcus sp.]|uniref:hypothetical protein n=1 Tax=Ruminococcus sp. TaxID=41978 RepID=UPI002873A961|nr:hypothetical protein [Ruminococcus sp.]MBQ3285919.1 hypothetical protein [Ruminococcus sp.]
MGRLWNNYKEKAKDIRPFLRTKIGSRLAILAIIDFIVLFFAPLLHGFVGTAIFGCVASVYLMLVWRRFDREHVVVPALILCVPMLLDMAIYHEISVIVGCLIAIVAMLLVALSRLFGFYDRLTDGLTSYLVAGAVCVAVVVLACITLLLVQVAWWILCIIAFFVVVAVFLGVVFSTAAYTASDGRRQARRERERSTQDQEQRYRDYQPRKRDTKVYNIDEDDDADEGEPAVPLDDYDFKDFE